jgi:G:T-mismatch repair DNA endonuclease (very short patch repair protein)
VAEVTVAHAKMHGFESARAMAKHYKREHLKCAKLIEGMTGESNPSYGHGGKLSPWSSNSGRSEDAIKASKQAAKDNSRGNKPNNLQHYLNKGYDLETAKLMLHAHQSNGRLKMMTLYGESEGERKWKQRQIDWQATLNAKPEEEKQRINKAKLSNGYSISKREIELLNALREHFSSIEDQKYLKIGGKGYSYDIAMENKIIEFFGDFWHHNPNKHHPDWVNPYTKFSSAQRWHLDQQRIEAAESLGYEVLVVWEQDWDKHKEEVIARCINFLKQSNESSKM